MKTEPKAKLAARLDAIAAAIRELDQINAEKRADIERIKAECRQAVGTFPQTVDMEG